MLPPHCRLRATGQIDGRGSSDHQPWFGSREYWDYLVQYYDGNYAESEFSEFFWTLNGILIFNFGIRPNISPNAL
jgi:hypothetical protein